MRNDDLISRKALMEKFAHPPELMYTNVVLDEIRSAPTIGGWVSVKDRLPPMYHMVLITGKNSAGGSFGVIKGSYDGDKGQWYRDDIGQYVDYRGDIVTHWMPLPEPPKEENDATD